MRKNMKDYANKSWIQSYDWEYHNKETYTEIAKYFAFVGTASLLGYLFAMWLTA